MATTSRESDFESIKRWGKAFLIDAAAGGSGIGQGGTTPTAMRFNPPPGWPPAPAGWVPDPGWQPDPSWPEPPAGWPLWVANRPALSSKVKESLLAIAGGTAVLLGSLLPWMAFSSAGVEYKPGAKAATAVVGLLIVALGFALRFASQPGRLIAGIVTVCLSSLAGPLYVIFIVAGLHGVPGQDLLGDPVTVRWMPSIGIILAAGGCAAAFIAAILSFHPRQD